MDTVGSGASAHISWNLDDIDRDAPSGRLSSDDIEFSEFGGSKEPRAGSRESRVGGGASRGSVIAGIAPDGNTRASEWKEQDGLTLDYLAQKMW